MKLPVVGALVLMAFTACQTVPKDGSSNAAQYFNFEAATAYFDLAGRLQEGAVLSDEEWQDFLDLEGNRLFITENNISTTSLDLIRSEIELVNDPDRTAELAARVEDDIRLRIRNRYKKKEFELQEHLTFLKSHPEVLQQSALQLVRAYLPGSMHSLDTFPQVYIHALWDGSASDKGIFVDIILQADFDEKRLGSFIAHELHHYMRSSVLQETEIAAADQGLVWAIESTFNEGLADMIDKSALVYEGSDWWLNDTYIALLNYGPPIMEGLDQFIQAASRGEQHSEEEYRELLANSVGHIPGQFMAQLILDHDRLDEIIAKADDPFFFFSIYNEIALSMEGEVPVFSQTTMDYIKQLQIKYLPSGMN